MFMDIIDLINSLFFYIGKGRGKRVFNISGRTQHFKNIFNMTECMSVILYKDLTEQQALDLEQEVIENLLDDGYSIEIDNYIKNENKTSCK